MIGTDILAIERMRRLYDKHTARSVTKILHPDEMQAFGLSTDKARFLAKRWAAKEAIAKALGTGLRAPLVMPAIIISHNSLGAPHVSFNATARVFVDQLGVDNVVVSISDEKAYVVAFAMAGPKPG